MIPKRKVNEVSSDWEFPLSDKFDALIESYVEKGYELESWQMQRVVHLDNDSDYTQIIDEKIVAVFVQKEVL